MDLEIHKKESASSHNVVNDPAPLLYVLVHLSYYNINPCALASINLDDNLNLDILVLSFMSPFNTKYKTNRWTIVESCSNIFIHFERFT